MRLVASVRRSPGGPPPPAMDNSSSRRTGGSSFGSGPPPGRPLVSPPPHRARTPGSVGNTQTGQRLPADATRAPQETLRCLGCGECIEGRYLLAPGSRTEAYHRHCLKCKLCNRPTERFVVVPASGKTTNHESVSSSGRNTTTDLMVCNSCHAQRFLEKCGACDLPLTGTTLAALGGKFHDTCFRCSLCDLAIATGTFVPMKENALSGVSKKNAGVACTKCHENKLAPKCHHCGEGVVGTHVVALGGKKFHNECFVCVVCRCNLGNGETHVPHENRDVYCGKCHVSKFAPRCACGCGTGVSGRVVSAMGRKYLPGHFRCQTCRADFANGDFMKVEVGEGTGGALSSPDATIRRYGNALTPCHTTIKKRSAVCQACYANNHAERCGVCSTPLVGCKFVRVSSGEDPGDDEKGEPMCLPCSKKVRACFSQIQAPAVCPYSSCEGTSSLCPDCLRNTRTRPKLVTVQTDYSYCLSIHRPIHRDTQDVDPNSFPEKAGLALRRLRAVRENENEGLQRCIVQQQTRFLVWANSVDRRRRKRTPDHATHRAARIGRGRYDRPVRFVPKHRGS